MNDTTTDWRDYIVYGYRFFRAQIPADALADDGLTVTGEATMEITAEAGVEDAGVTVAIQLPGEYQDVWFPVAMAHGEVNDAAEFAGALAAAAAAPGASSVQLHAWSCSEMPDLVPVLVEVATDPDEFDGVYLDINDTDEFGDGQRAAVMVSHEATGEAADAVTAAVDYLTHATPVAITVTGGTDEVDHPIHLGVVLVERHEPQVALSREPVGPESGVVPPPRRAVLTIESCHQLREALDNVLAGTGHFRLTLDVTDVAANPLLVELGAGGVWDTVLSFAEGPYHPREFVWLDDDTATALRDALQTALAAASDDTDGM